MKTIHTHVHTHIHMHTRKHVLTYNTIIARQMLNHYGASLSGAVVDLNEYIGNMHAARAMFNILVGT